MKAGAISFVIATICASEGMAGQSLEWAQGVGMTPCSRLDSIPDQRLQDWVLGCWTGANLYFGGTDLCRERAAIEAIPTKSIRTLIEVQCAPIQSHAVMFAAFNALKGLPSVEGSRSAGCQEYQP